MCCNKQKRKDKFRQYVIHLNWDLGSLGVNISTLKKVPKDSENLCEAEITVLNITMKMVPPVAQGSI